MFWATYATHYDQNIQLTDKISNTFGESKSILTMPTSVGCPAREFVYKISQKI